MPYNQHYGGVIWTNHALDRLHQRKLPQHIAFLAFQEPDARHHGKQAGTWEMHKQYGRSHITLIVKQNDKGEWLILSAWIDPPLPGTLDHKKHTAWHKQKKAGFWGKLWYQIKKQFGIY
jgi:hypothetical protein